ncbi:RNA polymerase sigma factor [Streptomyces hygroscopicus]|uniref:RNA polymerase sigma factor n=1 Tax=Streptomyces hygroscopicus TaxID=1912 RepID=UPI00223EA277|nr:hypothetical protein [Streptomyces hygroscopicus]
MTTPFESPAPAPGPTPVRPGRKLGPIADNVVSSHRAWLGPTKCSYITSGRTLSDLSDHVLLAKSKLSELLRGVGNYPRWEVIHRLSTALDIPTWPLYRLWRQAARDIGKTSEWIDRSSEGAASVTTRSGPPIEHGPLRLMVECEYRCYAQVFLPAEVCDAAVEDTFAILWLSWDDALASPDIRRYARNILRATVMAKATYRDNLPELENAVFDTVALRVHRSSDGRTAQLTESLELFKAISRLPAAQLDVMVLRYLCGATVEKASYLLGVPLAAVRSDGPHAYRFLQSALTLPPETERTCRVTPLQEILSRALLVRDRAVPRDVVPPSRPDPCPHTAVRPVKAGEAANTTAAKDLRALCEALVTHTPATAVGAFVTDQVPEPTSAMILACVLQLTDTDGGARFWWQYAAGAGQAAAAYCLYLHHLSLGEDDTARWWHHQTDDVHPTPPTDSPSQRGRIDTAPTSTLLRILRRLAAQTTRRPRSAAVTGLMKFVPTAVAVGYLREPDMELPLPGPDFACEIRTLLTTTASQPTNPIDRPTRLQTRPRKRRGTARAVPWVPEQMGETATRRASRGTPGARGPLSSARIKVPDGSPSGTRHARCGHSPGMRCAPLDSGRSFHGTRHGPGHCARAGESAGGTGCWRTDCGPVPAPVGGGSCGSDAERVSCRLRPQAPVRRRSRRAGHACLAGCR